MTRTNLPRYHPRQTHVGCKEHNDDTCLCDVILPSHRTPVSKAHGLMFGTLAMKELGVTHVSERNIYDFMSIVLGCHNRHEMMANPTLPLMGEFEPLSGDIVLLDREREARRNRRMAERLAKEAQAVKRRAEWSTKGGTRFQRNTGNAWGRLPEQVRAQLIEGYRIGLPWSEAKAAIADLGLSVEDEKYVRYRYGVAKADKRLRVVRMPDVPRVTEQASDRPSDTQTTVSKMRCVDEREVHTEGSPAIWRRITPGIREDS